MIFHPLSTYTWIIPRFYHNGFLSYRIQTIIHPNILLSTLHMVQGSQDDPRGVVGVSGAVRQTSGGLLDCCSQERQTLILQHSD
jgi:hypothetical protein